MAIVDHIANLHVGFIISLTGGRHCKPPVHRSRILWTEHGGTHLSSQPWEAETREIKPDGQSGLHNAPMARGMGQLETGANLLQCKRVRHRKSREWKESVVKKLSKPCAEKDLLPHPSQLFLHTCQIQSFKTKQGIQCLRSISSASVLTRSLYTLSFKSHRRYGADIS